MRKLSGAVTLALLVVMLIPFTAPAPAIAGGTGPPPGARIATDGVWVLWFSEMPGYGGGYYWLGVYSDGYFEFWDYHGYDYVCGGYGARISYNGVDGGLEIIRTCQYYSYYGYRAFITAFGPILPSSYNIPTIRVTLSGPYVPGHRLFIRMYLWGLYVP